MILQSIVLLSIFLSSYCDSFHRITSQLVTDFFMRKNVGVVIIFSCKQEDTFNLAKIMMENQKGRRMVVTSGANRPKSTLRTIMAATHYKLGAFVDLDCNDSILALIEISNLHLLHGTSSWLVWSDSYSRSIAIFDTLDLSVNSDVTLAVSNNKLYDLYKISKSWPLNSTEIGSWDNNLGFVVKPPQKRTNFHGIVYNASAVSMVPKLIHVLLAYCQITHSILYQLLFRFSPNESDLSSKLIDSSLDSHLDSLTRLGYIMMMYLQDIYNFTYLYCGLTHTNVVCLQEACKDAVYELDSNNLPIDSKLFLRINPGFSDNPGYKMNRGKHDGIIGQLERKEIEFALNPYQIMMDRLDSIDYTAPLWIYRICFVFRHPPTVGMYRVLVIPLSGLVWLCIGCIVVIAVVLYRAITQCHLADSLHIERSWSCAILLVVGSLTQQGLTLRSQRVSMRMLCFFLLLLGIMVYSFYSASVVTALLSTPPKTIQTVQQLIESDFTIGIEDQIYLRNYIMSTNDSLANKVFNRRIPLEERRSRLISYKDGIKKLANSKARFAFFAEDLVLYRPIDQLLTGPEKCSLMEIELFTPNILHIPIQKKSPLKESITQALLLMRERGLLMRQNKIWRLRKPECMGKLVDSVTVDSLMTAYLILFVGILLSLVSLSVEKTIHYRHGNMIGCGRHENVLNRGKLQSIFGLKDKHCI